MAHTPLIRPCIHQPITYQSSCLLINRSIKLSTDPRAYSPSRLPHTMQFCSPALSPTQLCEAKNSEDRFPRGQCTSPSRPPVLCSNTHPQLLLPTVPCPS